MVLGLGEGDAEQLVLSLGCLDLGTHLLRVDAEVLALILKVLDLLIVLLFDVHEALELVLVPFELLFKPNDSHILREFRVLLLRLGLEELELLLDLVHVRLEGEPEVILMLPEHVDQFLIIGAQSARDLLERALHFANIAL